MILELELKQDKNIIMACNCASQEQIEKLHEMYGHKIEPGTKKTLKFKIDNFFTQFGVAIILIILFPLLFGYVIYIGAFSKDGKISIREILGMKRGVDDAYLNYVSNNSVEKKQQTNDGEQ